MKPEATTRPCVTCKYYNKYNSYVGHFSHWCDNGEVTGYTKNDVIGTVTPNDLDVYKARSRCKGEHWEEKDNRPWYRR